jgi:hypothetical protein
MNYHYMLHNNPEERSSQLLPEIMHSNILLLQRQHFLFNLFTLLEQ